MNPQMRSRSQGEEKSWGPEENDKEVSKDVPHNSVEVDAGDREARNAEDADLNMKM